MRLKEYLRSRGFWFFSLALLAGTVLRLIWPADMEYKLDEQYMFDRVIGFGHEAWDWLGMPNTVGVRNPGLSIWVFIALGKLFGVVTPPDLVQAVQIVNVLSMILLVPFVFRLIPETDREPWFWGIALLAVNPIAVLYERKIWAQSILPIFVLLFLVCWWLRSRRTGAFFWGLVGAALGQIHMSGFFFAFGMMLWALFFDRRKVRWLFWLAGSALGALPMIPWIHYFLNRPSSGRAILFGFNELIQLKYWVFWITTPLGLHLGNALGVSNGNGLFQQLGDFFRYPVIAGQATYAVGAGHLLLAASGIWVLTEGIRSILYDRRHHHTRWTATWIGRSSETAFTQNAVLWGYGLVITCATVAMRRFYLIITYPFQYIWLARMALSRRPQTGRTVLIVILLAEFLVSASFLHYIHKNGGASQGDYGTAYRLQAR